MKVSRHAEVALVALTQKMPVPASTIIARLRAMPAPSSSTALEVCRMTMAHGRSDGSNGDTVIVIIKRGVVVTAMLRRSWNQPFTPAALRVEAVAQMECGAEHAFADYGRCTRLPHVEGHHRNATYGWPQEGAAA